MGTPLADVMGLLAVLLGLTAVAGGVLLRVVRLPNAMIETAK